MLVAISRAHGKEVFTNPTTANILQGFFASILEFCDWRGRVKGDCAILEVDEGHAAEILRTAKARFVTILNVTDDQLDRFIDPELVRNTLRRVAESASDGVILNADDQNMLILESQSTRPLAATSYFGFKPELIEDRFLGFAETYLPKIKRPKTSTEITAVKGQAITVSTQRESANFSLASRGIHYAADAAAALETARRIFESKFDLELAARTIQALPPVFARGEVTEIYGKEVELVLVQNPASFQLNLDAFESPLENVMIAIGRDVHDPSWLWTVDYSKLRLAKVVSGFNAYEMALCLSYNDVPVEYVSEDLEWALEKFLNQSTANSPRPVIFVSADAMRRYRRMLGFVAPDMVGSK
jgi:hypothetical protein